MRRFLKEYFTLTRSERNGLLVLLCLLILSIVFPTIYNSVAPKDDLGFEVIPLASSEQQWRGKPDSGPTINPKPFDPNRLGREGFLAMGLDSLTTDHIIKYRNAGGKFYEKTDLLQIYSMDKETFLELEPYIRLDNEQTNYFSEKRQEPVQPVDINTADSADFDQLPGIGSVYSQRIVNYREAAGGFDSISHLTRVYGIDSTLYHKISKYLSISPVKKDTTSLPRFMAGSPVPIMRDINMADSAELTKFNGIGPWFASRIVSHRDALGGFHSLDQLYDIYNLDSAVVQRIQQNYLAQGNVRKLNLNRASEKELAAHPYINRSVAEFIVTYRIEHLRITKLDELRGSYLVDEELLLKIAPYIKL